MGVDVVAVKAKPGFEPKAVARAKPDRQHVGIFEQLPRKPLGLFGRHRNLKTILAGVTGARDKAVEPIDPARHMLSHEVKAITYHELKVEPTDDGWLAEVIVDI